MKKLLLTLSATTAISLSTLAAANSPYIGVSGGFNLPSNYEYGNNNDWFKNGYVVGFKAGAHVFSSARADLSVDYLHNSSDVANNTSLKQTALFANMYYDFHNSSAFTPYLGGGLGYVHTQNSSDLNAGNPNNPFQSSSFGAQLTAGIQYAINDDLAVDFAYKGMGVSQNDGTGNHSLLTVGLQYNL